MTRFAIATRDELWSHGRLVERRLAHGEAVENERGIDATDARDETLLARCDGLMEQLRACIRPDLRMRLLAEASTDGDSATIIVKHAAHSVVTTPTHIDKDVELLRAASRSAGVPPAGQAASRRLLWKNASGSVLLHEAHGHPLEHNAPRVAWPTWLHIDAPLAMRRATFRDLPLLRMTTLTATQHNAPFELPADCIEVLLVDGGHYESLTDVVTIHIGAATMNGVPLAPFTIEYTREEIARAITGARREPIRYPGVICSREGQELVVGSYAPELLTVFA